ncbi:transposase [Pseudomonas sp. NPDC098747]
MRQRSSYPKPFKAQVVQECLQPGATLSSVAIRHGIVTVRPKHLAR